MLRLPISSGETLVTNHQAILRAVNDSSTSLFVSSIKVPTYGVPILISRVFQDPKTRYACQRAHHVGPTLNKMLYNDNSASYIPPSKHHISKERIDTMFGREILSSHVKDVLKEVKEAVKVEKVKSKNNYRQAFEEFIRTGEEVSQSIQIPITVKFDSADIKRQDWMGLADRFKNKPTITSSKV